MTPPLLPPLPQRTRRRLLLETGLAFAATVALIAGLVQLGAVWSWALALAQPAAALAFLYLPRYVLEREGTDPATMGIHARQPRRQLAWGLAVCAVVFPLFAVGYHLVATQWQGRQATWDERVWRSWGDELDGRPAALPPQAPIALWAERGLVYAFWNASPDEPLRMELELDAPPAAVWETYLRDGELWFRSPISTPAESITTRGDGSVLVRSSTARGLRIDPGAAQELTLRVTRGGEPVATHEVALGRYHTPATSLHFGAGWLWLVWLVLTHIVVVAIPEEVFYRGFLQSRFDQLWPPRHRLFGARIGPGLAVCALAFGLGHFLVELDFTRFEVFFPALLFGWLRNRVDSVAAPALVHGLSNVLLALLVRAYA